MNNKTTGTTNDYQYHQDMNSLSFPLSVTNFQPAAAEFPLPSTAYRQTSSGRPAISSDRPETKIAYPKPLTEALKPTLLTSDIQAALQLAGISIFNVDLARLKICFSAQHPSVCSLPVHQPISLCTALNLVHPDYQQGLLKVFKQSARLGKDLEYEFELKGSGTVNKWLKVTGSFNEGANGKSGYFLCILTDVSVKKKNEIRRSELVAMLNHDLRTPLTTIKLFIQMFSKLALKSEHFNASDLLHIASNQVDCMTKMIENFLETTVLESGKIKLNKTAFELRTLIRELIGNEYEPEGTHQFQINCPEKMWLNADRDKITQVLHNYLSNAVKYSPSGTAVSVCSRKIKDQIIISVKDNGIGIHPAEQKKLFSKFFRSETPAVQKIKGFGIGLYLVNDIVEQHEGKVWATSDPGKGSTFYFSLPTGS